MRAPMWSSRQVYRPREGEILIAQHVARTCTTFCVMHNFQRRASYVFRPVESPYRCSYRPAVYWPRTCSHGPVQPLTWSYILHTNSFMINQIKLLRNFITLFGLDALKQTYFKHQFLRQWETKTKQKIIIIKEICDICQKLCFIKNGGAFSGNGWVVNSYCYNKEF